ATTVALRVNFDSQVDILNNVFVDAGVALSRATPDAQVTNSAFVGNTITITSPVGLFVDPAVNVDNCGFFDNTDLVVGGVDTPLGNDPVVGDPRFVDPDARDFHLVEASPFIDVGIGNDSIDNNQADIGAYGGQFADPFPFPVPAPDVTDASGATPPPYSVDVEWQANLSYLVTNSTTDGSYRVYYRQNASGPPYDGTDAGNGSQPSPVDAGAATMITLADLQPSVAAPAAPQLLSAAPQTSSVVLAWTAVTEADAYRVHWGLTAVSENSADVGDVTTFTVTGLDNGVTYIFAVSALRQPVYHIAVTVLDNTQNQNESDFSPESTIAIGPLFESVNSNELSASPDETIPIPNLPDKGCFVATAAFGSDWAAEVLVLRDFRDGFLHRSAFGRSLVEWYYRHGPDAARFIAPRERLRALVRIALTPAVGVALILSGLTPLTTSALVLLGGLLAQSILRRRRAVP
ncbi:MAG: CFI-box-CTERM domain-containing protein, partial [Gammaproteobacteria bacterium]